MDCVFRSSSMDSNNSKSYVSSQAYPETMDLLSHAWCNFAVQALQQPDQSHDDRSIVVHDDPILEFDDFKTPILKLESSLKLDESLPPSWKSNDFKSWIWMQQAMHPEVNYNSCFKKKWTSKLPWKIIPSKITSIKKWLKDIKSKRKEQERLQRAEVHAAISVAGVAAALAAIAAADDNTSKQQDSSSSTMIVPKDCAALASAAALVAAECAKVAEAMGAKREELRAAIGSAVRGTSASEILTLTAAASTSLRGAATLKVRRGSKNILNGNAPVLPIEDNYHHDFEFRH